MSDSTAGIPRIEEAEAEVELSAQELLALANPEPIDQRQSSSVLQPSRPTASVSPRKQPAPRASIYRRVSASHLAVSLIVVVGIVGSTYILTRAGEADRPTANAPQQTAQAEQPALEQLVQGPPVRFTNPFDAEEVFEFPPGTTEAEARDAVAEFLLQRAMSRQKT